MEPLQRIHYPVYTWFVFVRITWLSSYPKASFTYAFLFIGRLNQVEYSERIDPILFSANGDKSHLHNQLLAAIYGNLTREMPDQGVAPWVSANDKPTTNVGAKPVTGDAAERRLKGEVMQLPSRDRRRIKELAQNDVRILTLVLSTISTATNILHSLILSNLWQICSQSITEAELRASQIFLRVLTMT